MLRGAVLAAVIGCALVLGCVQLASSAAYGDLAVWPSFPALLHAGSPRLLRPFVGGARARAAAAVHDGEFADAQRLLDTLPGDAESADLRGRIAQARGERDTAVAQYVRAGDVVRAQALIDALAGAEPARALRDQELLVAGLRGDASAAEVTGQAWWRLGQLQALAGYRDPSRRPALWRRAESSYERALSSAPNEETYLLAAGYQSLANGDAAAATRWYSRAAEVVPDSAAAFAGLAWAAAARHDCASARTSLARSRTLRAPGVRDAADDPLLGPPLVQCAR